MRELPEGGVGRGGEGSGVPKGANTGPAGCLLDFIPGTQATGCTIRGALDRGLASRTACKRRGSWGQDGPEDPPSPSCLEPAGPSASSFSPPEPHQPFPIPTFPALEMGGSQARA